MVITHNHGVDCSIFSCSIPLEVKMIVTVFRPNTNAGVQDDRIREGTRTIQIGWSIPRTILGWSSPHCLPRGHDAAMVCGSCGGAEASRTQTPVPPKTLPCSRRRTEQLEPAVPHTPLTRARPCTGRRHRPSPGPPRRCVSSSRGAAAGSRSGCGGAGMRRRRCPSASAPAPPCCRASTTSPTPSRSPWGPRSVLPCLASAQPGVGGVGVMQLRSERIYRNRWAFALH